MTLFKIYVLVAVLVVLVVQLEFLFHISEPLFYRWRQLTDRFLNTAFIVAFLLWLYLAYEIRRLKRQLSEFSYLRYKKNDDWQREVKLTTNEELRKLTSSEAYKEWERERREHHRRLGAELDSVEEKFLEEIDRAVFGEPAQPTATVEIA